MFPGLPVTLLDIPRLPLDGAQLPDPALCQLDGNGGLREGTTEQPWGFRQWSLNKDELGLAPHRSRTCPARADRGLCNSSGRSGLPSSAWVLLHTWQAVSRGSPGPPWGQTPHQGLSSFAFLGLAASWRGGSPCRAVGPRPGGVM